METYSLLELVIFLREQQSCGYQAVNTILGIMYDTDLSEGRKKALTVSILRNYGLFELEYEEEIFFEDSEEFQDIDPETSWEDDIMIPLGFYYCKLMDDHIVEWVVVLN